MRITLASIRITLAGIRITLSGIRITLLHSESGHRTVLETLVITFMQEDECAGWWVVQGGRWW